MISLSLLPPWVRWVALAAVVGGIAWLGWTVNGWRHAAAERDTAVQALDDYKAQVAARDSQHAAQISEAQQRAAQLAGDLESLQATYHELAIAAARAPLVQYREVPVDAEGRCRVPARTELYRLCHNAAWSGDAAALAACQTGAGDAAAGRAVPAAGLVRPRDP